MTTIALSSNREPEPRKNSILKESGLDFLEHYAPGAQAPEEAKVVLLYNELIRLGVSPKSLQSLQVGKPQAVYSSTSLTNEDILTGYSTNVNMERYFLYFNDFRALPFVLIASKTNSCRDISVRCYDNGSKSELDNQLVAREVYKTLSALHGNSKLSFQSSGANKPYT